MARRTKTRRSGSARRRCMWPPCPNLAVTREHLFPNWINEVLPVGPNVDWYPGERLVNKETTGPRQGRPATRRYKIVCADCNTKWMSQIETRARHVLTPMILAQTTALSVADQALIAKWVVMRTYVWEEHTGRRSSTDTDRELLYVEKRPSDKTCVRLAALAAPITEPEIGIYHYLLAPPVAPVVDDAGRVGYVCTVVLGALVIQALSLPSVDNRMFEEIGIVDDATRVVMPSTPAVISWPPADIMTWSALSSFISKPLADYPPAVW